MAKADTGGSVFPSMHTSGAITRPDGGLSRRDHFAAAALMGMASQPAPWNWTALARAAAAAADALLAELDVTGLELADPDEGD